jgi:hypothetical protein
MFALLTEEQVAEQLHVSVCLCEDGGLSDAVPNSSRSAPWFATGRRTSKPGWQHFLPADQAQQKSNCSSER